MTKAATNKGSHALRPPAGMLALRRISLPDLPRNLPVIEATRLCVSIALIFWLLHEPQDTYARATPSSA